MPVDEVLAKATEDLDEIIGLNLVSLDKIDVYDFESLVDLKIAMRDARLAMLTGDNLQEKMAQFESALKKVSKEVMIYDDKVAFKLSLVEKSLANIQQEHLLELWQNKFGEYTNTVNDQLALSDMMQVGYKATGMINRIITALQANDKVLAANELRDLNKLLDNNLATMNDDLKSYPVPKLLSELKETISSGQFSALSMANRAGSTKALYEQLHKQTKRTPLDDPALTDGKAVELPKVNKAEPVRANTEHLQKAANKVEKRQEESSEKVVTEKISIRIK